MRKRKKEEEANRVEGENGWCWTREGRKGWRKTTTRSKMDEEKENNEK